MKKSMLLVFALLTVGNFLFSACSMRMFEGRTYVHGQHATKHGEKAQARVNRQAKHYWF